MPSSGYPICIEHFWTLYWSEVQAIGYNDKSMSSNCPSTEGDWYKNQNGYQRGTISWIYHPVPSNGFPSNTWHEVHHGKVSGEIKTAWFMSGTGSGIFLWLGTTKVYTDHDEAAQDLCNEASVGFDKLGPCALNHGLDTFQFTAHRSNEWDCGSSNALNVEIVSAHLSGQYSCASQTTKGVFKAGWEASQDCDCDSSKSYLNCYNSPGVPPN